jgi:4-amino-4-deoxy-L-arabinose transferase-like glycosyltransferase
LPGRRHLRRLILIIIVLAALIRLLGLGSLPAALNRDEAAIGYNAYSLLLTGKDEHGVSWPANFKSIGDYKMPGYIYATILPVKLFGLNDFSIRFWSALAGVVAVAAVYLITRSLIAAGLMAFNPWAIFYSRIAFEANLALALFLIGLWLLLKRRSWGFIFWLLAGLTYSSSLIFIPLFFVAGFIWLKPKIIPSILFAAVFSLIFVRVWVVSSQKANVTIFSDPATIDYYNQTRTKVYEQNPLLARTWWNKNVFYARIGAVNYAKTFSPRFLLTQGGGHPWHQIPNMGYFYLAEILLAISGLIYLFKSRHRWRWWLLAWLLLAPLASAITIDAPHATRSLYLLPVVIILAGFGLPKKKSLLVWLSGLYAINLVYFGYQYLVKYPQFYQTNLPVGLKESLEFVNSKNLNGNIYLTGIHDSTYLYPLVYTGFEPAKFQTEAVWTEPDTVGLANAYRFGQFMVVDDLVDVVNPAALILPEKFISPEEPVFESGNYRVILD